MNWYCNSLDRHLCTTWGTLASDSKNLFSPLKSDSTVNYDPQKYFLNFPAAHLNAATSPTKICLDFSSGDTVDIEMKDIGRKRIPSRDLSNSQFLASFSYASGFIASSETSSCRIASLIPYLDQYILINNLLYEYDPDKVGPDKIYFFNLSSKLWSSVSRMFCISSIYSFWDSAPGWVYFQMMYIQGLMSSSYKGKNGCRIGRSQLAYGDILMYLVALAWQKPHFWTVEVVFYPLPYPYLRTSTSPETISTFSVLV